MEHRPDVGRYRSVTSGAFTLVRLAMTQRAPDEDPGTSRLGPEGIAAARQLSSLCARRIEAT